MAIAPAGTKPDRDGEQGAVRPISVYPSSYDLGSEGLPQTNMNGDIELFDQTLEEGAIWKYVYLHLIFIPCTLVGDEYVIGFSIPMRIA